MLKVGQLQAFNEVMLTGSISQAARNLHRTQSSVSATIASIEDALQMQLFERRSGRLHPVPEAEYFHTECLEILRRLESVTDNMHRLQSLQTGELHIASMPGPSIFLLPALIAENPTWAKSIRTEVVSRSSEGVYRLMSGQRYDIGLADYVPELADTSHLLQTERFEFPCVCAIPGDHPLASKRTVTPHDLVDVSIATLGQEHAVYYEVRRAFREMNLTPTILHTTQYFLSLFTYVERGIACAIVDPLSVENYELRSNQDRRIVFRPFEPKVLFRMGLIRPMHRPTSVISTHFCDRIREELSKAESSGVRKTITT
ncbi:MAG: LysR substrate-binding domain-containing protein [Pseudomonadota bacterium]